MPTLKLTKRTVETLVTPTDKRVYYRDSDARGLQLCITPTGHKSWQLYRRVHGRPQRILIGTYPEVTPHLARKRAIELAGEIAQGRDPQTARRQKRRETTLEQLFDVWLAVHAKPKKRTWQADQAAFDRHFTRWKKRPLSSITRADVRVWHAAIGKNAPYAANRALALMNTLYNHAEDLIGYEGTNPATRVPRFQEVERERYLEPSELPAFLKAVQYDPSSKFRDFVLVLILTGARRGNVMTMRWADIDWQRGTWTIPGSESKSGKPIVVPLVPFVHDLLLQRHEECGEGEYVFPGMHGKGHLRSVRNAWTALVERAGLKDLRMHDLRRTLGSWAAAGGVSLPIIGKALGHRDQSTTQIYARLNLDPVRAALEKTADALLEHHHCDQEEATAI